MCNKKGDLWLEVLGQDWNVIMLASSGLTQKKRGFLHSLRFLHSLGVLGSWECQMNIVPMAQKPFEEPSRAIPLPHTGNHVPVKPPISNINVGVSQTS